MFQACLIWLLVRLYHLATGLCHLATAWQGLLRQRLLPFALRRYRPRWPLAAPPVKPWPQRLAEADAAGQTLKPVRHRHPLPASCHCPPLRRPQGLSL